MGERGRNAVGCPACDFVYYHSSVAAVVGIVEHRDRVVVTHRANDPHKGMWAIPGGFVEYGESLEAALLRELREELNLEIAEPRYLASFGSEYPYRGVLYFPTVAYFVTRIDRRQASFRFSDNCFSRSVDGLCTPEMTYRHH